MSSSILYVNLMKGLLTILQATWFDYMFVETLSYIKLLFIIIQFRTSSSKMIFFIRSDAAIVCVNESISNDDDEELNVRRGR